MRGCMVFMSIVLDSRWTLSRTSSAFICVHRRSSARVKAPARAKDGNGPRSASEAAFRGGHRAQAPEGGDDAGRARARGRSPRAGAQVGKEGARLRQRRLGGRRAALRRGAGGPLRARAPGAARGIAHYRHLGAHRHRQRLRFRPRVLQAGRSARQRGRRAARHLDVRQLEARHRSGPGRAGAQPRRHRPHRARRRRPGEDASSPGLPPQRRASPHDADPGDPSPRDPLPVRGRRQRDLRRKEMTRKLLGLALLAATLPALQGRFPLPVTGLGPPAVLATHRRTAGTYLEDETIEWKVFGPMREKFPNAHANATSFNRRVLLTGEAPSDEMKQPTEEALRALGNVKEVTNELQVAGASSIASRGNDSLITSNVKARMLNNGKFSPLHVKVLTEAGVVYLMGLVTPREGDAAVEIARTTSGVNRVVKVFEYVGK